jgi:type III secretion system YscJ/HrcJ family lipoprotein
MSIIQKKYFFLLAFASLFLMACERPEIVVEGLTQNDANEILVVLKDHQVAAHKEVVVERKQSSYAIKVNKTEVDKALRILVNNQLPKTFRAGLRDVYPPGSQGLIPTKSDENARLVMALQGEIEALIRVLPGIVDTRVMLSLDFGHRLEDRSASVALIHRAGQGGDLVTILEIKNLVASAAGNMAPEQVQVVFKELAISEAKNIEPIVEKNSFSAQLVWALLSLTILALIIAAYAFLRPYLSAKLLATREL